MGRRERSRDRPLAGHEDAIISVAFSPDGAYLVTASADGTARVWDARGGDSSILLRVQGGALHRLAFSADGARIVTASNDITARVRDAKSGALLRALEGHERAAKSV